MLSRSMKERSWLAWIATLATWTIFYLTPSLLNVRENLHWLAINVFSSNYTRMLKAVLIVSATIPWLIAAGFYFSLYYLRIPMIEKYRLQVWAWDQPASPRREQYMLLLRKTVRTLWIKNILWSSGVILVVFDWVFDSDRDLAAYIDAAPSCMENFIRLMLGLLIFDALFYWVHRLLHARWSGLYKYHKDHHSYYIPTALAGAWMHDLDDIVTAGICGFIPAYFLNYHFVTFIYFNVINIFHSCYDHAGYALPWDPMQLIPFASHADSHNAHHSLNQDNFGLYFRHWDRIMGTDAHWRKYQADRDEAIARYRKHVDAGGDPCARLEHGDFVVVDGVAVARSSADAKERGTADDNLAFTIRTKILQQHDEEPHGKQL